MWWFVVAHAGLSKQSIWLGSLGKASVASSHFGDWLRHSAKVLAFPHITGKRTNQVSSAKIVTALGIGIDRPARRPRHWSQLAFYPLIVFC